MFLYSTFHGGKVSHDRTNKEYFVEKPNKPSLIKEPGMLSGPKISHERRYNWRGRSAPLKTRNNAEQPTISAQKEDKSYYNEKSYQARQENAKFEQGVQDLINSDAVSFGSRETGLGAVQCLYEGLGNASMVLTIEASGLPKAIPTLSQWLERLNDISDLPAAAKNVENTYKESHKQGKNGNDE